MFALPIATLLARIRKLIPNRHDDHYDEIARGFGNGALRAPATPMSDHELSRAIAEFLKDAPSAGLRRNASAAAWIPRRRSSAIAGTNAPPSGFSPERSFAMPVWMEVLVNVIGYAGFVGVATFNRSLCGWSAAGAGQRLRQLAFCPCPAVRTILSALTSTRSFSGGARSEKRW